MPTSMAVRLKVNGQTRQLTLDTRTSLLDALRDHLGLAGTKKGCDHGQCGACTVLVNGQPMLSCLTPAATVNGTEITTIEGLNRDGGLHPLQEGFHLKLGSQCGFCTPGMVMTAKALLDENPSPAPEQIKSALANNLCRCTGYNTIVESVQWAAAKMRESGQ